MEILVETPTGRTLSLAVSSHDTIRVVKAKLKAKLEAEEVIPDNEQRLVFVAKLLDGYHPLVECNITNGSTLQLVRKYSFEDTRAKLLATKKARFGIFAKTPTGKTLSLAVSSHEKLKS